MGYRGKVVERHQARELRAQGATLAEIADQLGVSRSSVSVWVRDVSFEPRPRVRARRRAPNALQRRRQAEIDELLAQGRARIGDLDGRDLLIAGTALYAGEGGKRDGEVSFVNSDPAMVELFCRWIRVFFDIDETRLRVRLYLHEGLDMEAANRRWSEVTGVPLDEFRRPYRASVDRSIRSTKHEFGCASVTYSCARTHRAVMGLVRALLSCQGLPG
jgi:transcriptional regulator with XRE-family HTH domain